MDTADWLKKEAARWHAIDFKLGEPLVEEDWAREIEGVYSILADAVRALEQHCVHQEIYEERNDGASDIDPDIMHPGRCGEDTICKPCGSCAVIAQAEKLWTDREAVSGEEE